MQARPKEGPSQRVRCRGVRGVVIVVVVDASRRDARRCARRLPQSE
jgi:hypothetical protein